MSYTFVGLDHVQLAAPAGCEEEARAFYGELIGLPELPKPLNLQKRGGVWFQCGKHEIHIGVEADFKPARKAHPGFEVNDLPALRAKFIEAGRSIVEDEQIEGRLRFHTEDPFGNRLEFIEFF
ncbi:glyoxalase [Paenibacillus sp. N1-5-1-14]|uniref:VOC family protein n=1 Tax=Paenibacillus radicibacter TaxID=2972488 RepID=UPI002158B696|nr:VOC family protein [Paenibacillus radicibacter]MCR8643100.1 glyoxalase [Paenibacillus radicibacter]